MSKNTEANRENQVLSSQDALSELLRSGAQRLIAQAIETEVEHTLAEYQDMTTIPQNTGSTYARRIRLIRRLRRCDCGRPRPATASLA